VLKGQVTIQALADRGEGGFDIASFCMVINHVTVADKFRGNKSKAQAFMNTWGQSKRLTLAPVLLASPAVEP
jgi:hypothetical protein